MGAGVSVLERLEPLTLAQLDAAVALRVRADRKYLVELPAVEELLDRLAGTHRALEIGGRRAFAYDTVYFDSADLLTVRAHVQRRRRRFKVRSRLYVDSGACFFELKLKDGRGQTVKHRIAHPTALHGAMTAAASAFLAGRLEDLPELEPVLRTTYRRTTLAGGAERVTVDSDVSFGRARLRPGWAIVETKSARGRARADAVLRDLGARPVPLSKYLIGAGLLRLPSPPNETRWIARRYFAHA
jgi:hypothetical protein